MAQYFPIRDDFGYFWPFTVLRLVDEKGILSIDVEDENDGTKLQVVVTTYLAYRMTDEGYLLVTVGELGHTLENRHWLYRVEDSEFLKWFNDENYGVHKESGIAHYAVVTSNEWVDVIAYEPPQVEGMSR